MWAFLTSWFLLEVPTLLLSLSRIKNLYERAQKNGVKDVKMIDGSQIKEYEPYCKVGWVELISLTLEALQGFQGLKALWSPHTGIVEWGEVAKAFAADFEKRGGTVMFWPIIWLVHLRSCAPSLHQNDCPKQSESGLNRRGFHSRWVFQTSCSERRLFYSVRNTLPRFPLKNCSFPFFLFHFPNESPQIMLLFTVMELRRFYLQG